MWLRRHPLSRRCLAHDTLATRALGTSPLDKLLEVDKYETRGLH